MKRIIWYFRIRNKIKRGIVRTEKEQLHFEEILAHPGMEHEPTCLHKVDMKKEVIAQLKALLYE